MALAKSDDQDIRFQVRGGALFDSELMTSQDYRMWFLSCLHNKINRHCLSRGRKDNPEYLIDMVRAKRVLSDPRRMIHSWDLPVELRNRFDYLIHESDSYNPSIRKRKVDKVSKQSSSLDYIPPSPDSEVLYPLAGNTQLVITTYESSSRSSPVDLTIQGLSRADLNIIVNALIHGEGFSIAGDDDDIATCEAIAEGQLFTPRSNTNINDMSAKSSRLSSRQPKPRSINSEGGKRSRISSDDLQEAIDILRVIEPQGIAKSDILEQSGIDERLWIPAMKALIEEGVWRVEGVKRGARYYVVSN